MLDDENEGMVKLFIGWACPPSMCLLHVSIDQHAAELSAQHASVTIIRIIRNKQAQQLPCVPPRNTRYQLAALVQAKAQPVMPDMPLPLPQSA
jgi:hypothetical protein